MKKSDKKDQRKRKGRKVGIIAAGVTVVLYALLFPLYRIADFVICGLLALLAGKVIGAMGEGLDLTTHNRQDQKAQPKPVEELPLSGNGDADAVIAKGQEMLHTIRAENDAITDEVLSGQMDELERLCVQIFTTVAEKPQKAPQIRKFMNYYLPTTLKMLASYRTMNDRGVSVTDMTEARATTIRGMGMVLTACQKQLDNLYKDTMLDVSTDIDVLEQMLKRDGYADGGLGQVPAATAGKPSATAASQQMNDTGAPVLRTPGAGKDDDFVSFYSQDRKS
ncbi:MAG: 5-bromo-4-chloroindolyl phosphate hydrolysis family protein [Aristaeellaceae bacterium]